MLSRLVITFLPRSKRLLISWLQSPSAVILEPPKIKSATVAPSISHEVMGLDVTIFVFLMLSFKPTFSLSFFTFIKSLFRSSSLSAIKVVSVARESAWRDEPCQQRMMQPLTQGAGLYVYFKHQVFFYTFTKALGQRFDFFSFPSPRFNASINHCCSSTRVTL